MSRTAGPLRTRTARRVTRLGHLRVCLPAAALTAVAAALAFGAVSGPVAAAGAVFGVVVAAATFSFGVLCVDLADRIATPLVLPVGLTAYALTVLVLGVVVVRTQAGSGGLVAGLPWGVVAGTLVWVTVQSWWAWTSPTPYVEL